MDEQVFVESIEFRGRAIQMHARRVCLVFDSQGKPYREVPDSLAESQPPDRDKLEGSFQDNEVDVEIGLSQPAPQNLYSAMNAVFPVPGDSIRDAVPRVLARLLRRY